MTATDTTNDDLAIAIANLATMVSDQFTEVRSDIGGLKEDSFSLKQGLSNLWVEQQRTSERLGAVENEIQGIHSDILEIYDRI